MSQAYNRPPSDIYQVQGATGLFFDKGIFLFGKYVEGVVQRAGQDALSPAFGRMAEQRAFAAAMGDDMSESSVGFADPFADGGTDVEAVDGEDEIIASGY